VHHAEVLVLRGDSCRLKGKGKEVLHGPRFWAGAVMSCGQA
jgi:hypothetical protein